MREIWHHFIEIFLGIWQYPIFAIDERRMFTLATLTWLLFLLVMVLMAGRYFRHWIVSRFLRRTNLQPSLQYSIAKITHYAFVAVGFLIALQIVGINLSSLAVVVGAIGIGVGFGLQTIVNNFVSGIILLLERPVNVGDRIEVAGVAGRVIRIGSRSTTVQTNDNISIIVPNADLISHSVTNWSLGDPSVRVRVPFSVAYGTDLEKLKRLMIEVAGEHPKALKDPQPNLYFDSFGDSALKFELAVWTSEMSFNPRRFRSDLNFAIEKKLRENHIEIPFHQLDLHLRSGELRLKQDSVQIARESKVS